MRRLLFAILVSSLLLIPAFVQKGNIPAAKASSSIYQGDLVLSGNTVYTIENRRFDINGSVIVEGNASLILKNAIINFTQTDSYQYYMTFRSPANGNPRLRVENATITASDYHFMVNFYDNSSATISNLTTPSKICLRAGTSSFVSMSNSTMYRLWATAFSTVNVSGSTITWLSASQSPTVTVSNCTISSRLETIHYPVVNISNSTIRELWVISDSVDCRILGLEPGFLSSWNYWLDCSVIVAPGGYAPEVTLKDSQIEGWRLKIEGSSNATITNSTIESLETRGSSVTTASNSTINWLTTGDDSVVWLVNSTCSSYIHDESKVYVCWYLDVHVVDSEGTDVPSANVTVAYPNATVAESKLTDAQGWARLTLMEKMTNETGDYPVGKYTVEATYLSYSNDTTVNMTENKEISLDLEGFVIPEFPSLFILPLFMMATLLAVIVYRKNSGFRQFLSRALQRKIR